MKAIANKRKPYKTRFSADQIVDAALRILRERGPDGVVVVTEPLPLASIDALTPPKPGTCVVALDEVGNPHNLGAIIRSAAWFGAHLLVPRSPKQASLSAAAVRTAQGGAEVVSVVGVDALNEGLQALNKAGYLVLGAAFTGFHPQAFRLRHGHGPRHLDSRDRARGRAHGVR